jgi:hypothetical protein
MIVIVIMASLWLYARAGRVEIGHHPR